MDLFSDFLKVVGRAISNDHLKALINISKILQTISNGIVKNTVTTYAAHDTKIKKFVESKLEQMTLIGNKIMNEGEIETLRALIDTDNVLLPAYADQIKEESLSKLYDALMQSRPTIVRSSSDSQWVSSNSDIARILREIGSPTLEALLAFANIARELILTLCFAANCSQPKQWQHCALIEYCAQQQEVFRKANSKDSRVPHSQF